MAKHTQTESAPAPERKTPAQWGETLGHVRNLNPNLPQGVRGADAEHAVADVLHGWSEHEHHYANEPLLLTQAEYEDALVASGMYPTRAPVSAALSKVVAAKFVDFTPRKARGEGA